jgi:hypothetical protein
MAASAINSKGALFGFTCLRMRKRGGSFYKTNPILKCSSHSEGSDAVGARRYSRRSALFLEPSAALLEVKNCSTSHNTCSAAGDFLDGIPNSAMAIWRHELQALKQRGATKDDQANKNEVPGISQVKQQPENGKCGDMFKPG